MSIRCASCPSLTTNPNCRQVFASGPSPCSILFLGGGPGSRESDRGIPYCGRAGEEFDNTYLTLANMYRDDVAVGNASLCWSGDDRPPSDKRVLDCARTHLPALLDRVKPDVLVLMGGVTNRIVDTRIRLDTHHGRPIKTSVLEGVWEGWVWPSYEPALGMRETTKMTQLMTDFRHLGEWLTGTWTPPYETEEVKDYQVASTVRELEDYLYAPVLLPRYEWPGVDTERHGRDQWSVQVSIEPNTGRLIRAGNMEVLQALSRWMREEEIALHFAGQDLDELDRLGMSYGKFRDTMQEAYHQCSLPQGLKALVYRLFGAEMHTWSDVVWPASVDAFLSWASAAILLNEANPIEEVTQLKRGKCVECGHLHSKGPCKREGCGCVSTEITFDKVTYKNTAIHSILTHIVRHTEATRDEEDPYHPWKKLVEMRETGLRGKVATRGEWDAVEELLGTTPILGIGNVTDEREELQYSCLAAESRVITEDGSRKIKDLVDAKFTGEVLTTSKYQVLEWKPVIGWQRNEHTETVDWISVVTEYTQYGRFGKTNTRYTPDHRLLTSLGWMQVKDILPGHLLILPIEELDTVQEQVVLGSLLGDGCILRRNQDSGWGCLRTSHCLRQKPYLVWTSDLLTGLIAKKPHKVLTSREREIAGRWAYTTEHWSLYTIHHPSLGKLRDECYKRPYKKSPPNLKNIGALGLAIWYQDDGSILRDPSSNGRPRFYSLSFLREETEYVCDVLYEKFGLEPAMSKAKSGWFISINGKSADAFYELVAEHIHPCMQYKIPNHWKGRFNPNPRRLHNGCVDARVTSVFHNPASVHMRGSKRTSYCLTVSDNHNFCTLSEVAHNCGDADWTGRVAAELAVRRGSEKWKVNEHDWDK